MILWATKPSVLSICCDMWWFKVKPWPLSHSQVQLPTHIQHSLMQTIHLTDNINIPRIVDSNIIQRHKKTSLAEYKVATHSQLIALCTRLQRCRVWVFRGCSTAMFQERVPGSHQHHPDYAIIYYTVWKLQVGIFPSPRIKKPLKCVVAYKFPTLCCLMAQMVQINLSSKCCITLTYAPKL